MKIHILGIAGAGMNGLAQILLDKGHVISGGDRLSNKATAFLEKRGVEVFRDTDIKPLKGADCLLISSAIKNDHPLITYAVENKIKIKKRKDFFMEFSNERDVIAIAGSHGKTTVTFIISHIIENSSSQAGFLVGIHGAGSGKWGEGSLVLEADEYDNTFLSISPKISLITNIDRDHTDMFKDDQSYYDAFNAFASLSNSKKLIVFGDQNGINNIFSQDLKITNYGIDKNNNSFYASEINTTKDGTKFLLNGFDKPNEVFFPSFGDHMVNNIIGSIIICNKIIEIPMNEILKALNTLPGIYRRLEFKGEFKGISFYDDYAHHPTEVLTTINALKNKYPKKRLITYFQPHTYSRLESFLSQFAEALENSDYVVVGSVYGARELGGKVSSLDLFNKIENENKILVGKIDDAEDKIENMLKDGDVLLSLNAGDGYKVGEKIINKLS